MRSTEGARVLWQGARGDSARVEAWVHFIRRADAFYAGLAQQRGEPYTPVGQDEMEAAAASCLLLICVQAGGVT